MDLTNRSGGFPRLSRRGLGVMAAMLLTLGPVGLVAATSAGMASASVSGTVVYSAHESIPAPPASNFAGSAGGDGWGLAFTTTAVFNVFHHDSVLQVACHLQKNATPCWAPKTITDGSGNNFSSAGQPGLWMDQANGHLYVFATRVSDQTAGVVCIDTTQPGSVLDPFCGFTALSAVGAAPITFGFSNVSDPIVVGTSWYAFNAAPGTQAGTRNTMLCFSLTTFTACPSQPFAVDLGGSVTVTDSAPPPPMAAFGNQIVMPASLGSSQILACFDGSTHGTCSGAWPVDISSLSYGFSAGAPFPILNGDGTATGFCLAFASDPCWSLAGSPVSSPPGITAAVPPNTVWNGTAVTIGTRMYLPDFIANAVDCYDYTAGASCAGFPKVFDNLGFLYTVTVDPQRPTCIWVNSDHGTDQIQDFDAYTGGSCGEGPVRVLAASIVAPHSQCIPSNYTSLQVTAPARHTYSSGSVHFEDFDGNPIPSIPDQNLDATGKVDLSPLKLATTSALPQFLITLNGAGSPPEVSVTLTWVGKYSPACTSGGQTVTGQSYRLGASDGGVFDFGQATFYGSMTGKHLNGPEVGIASTPDNAGYWLVASDGGVFAFGDAQFHGSLGARGHLTAPIVGIARTPDGRGYWLVAANGGVFAYGDAANRGSLGAGRATAPIVGIAATPSGHGYWLTGSDGNVYGFGDAKAFGSMHGKKLNAPVVGMAASVDGKGYWLVGSDGGVFAFGDAPFLGSMTGRHLSKPAVGIQRSPSGAGYWLDAADGGVFAFGDSEFLGSMAGSRLNAPVDSISS